MAINKGPYMPIASAFKKMKSIDAKIHQMIKSAITLKKGSFSEKKEILNFARMIKQPERLGWKIIILGQFVRFLKSNGQFMAPQFVRHHMSNIADGGVAAIMIDQLQLVASGKLGLKVKPRPIASAFTALAIMGAFEAWEASWPDRHFDKTDMAIHIGSTVAYAAYGTYMNRRRRIAAPKPAIAIS